MNFKELLESPVGKKGRTSVKDAHAHISPELEKEFFKLVKLMGGKTVADVLLNNITVATVGTSDSNLKKYQDNNHVDATKGRKINEDHDDIVEKTDAETLLGKANIKIKSKFETKFGSEFVLAKKYPEDEVKKALDGHRVTFDGTSIFVSKSK
jgi:hypothetical protein